ncbi:hypothetical protein JNUCC1_01791 [Lentibacillus sp. JNUCC-1]|uniref:hypothetical protein n=1 Tax=Lentibacillus sp. JNUCC-1 TaxID=2654513 RepID=UPI001325073E|nr:hypothetical protein [Lentibacillus sp. JNUCC-1]MUV37983.1 hypothetical protein [Lentibacillus sp. JNUCC-1]
MKKGTIGMILFAGLFVGVVVFVSEYLFPGASVFITAIIAGISALIGGLVGNKVFLS